MFESLHDAHACEVDWHTYYFMLTMYCKRFGEEENLEAFKTIMTKDGMELGVLGYIQILERYFFFFNFF